MTQSEECELVQDLLLGYSDNILNEYSQRLVEKHLKICDKCKNSLTEIKKDSTEETEEKEIEYFKKVNKKMNKKNVLLSISCVIILLVIIIATYIVIAYSGRTARMEVFISKEATFDEKTQIKEIILSYNDKASIMFVSQDDAKAQLKEKFGENGYLVDNINIFKESYLIEGTADIIQEIIKQLKQKSGIDNTIVHLNNNPFEIFLMDIMTENK